MTGLVYLGALLLSLGGLAVLDRRFRLAFWYDARRAAWTVGLGVVGFLLWDVAGLALGIFARGDSPHMTGLLLAPELPVEEAFFLALLTYVGLLAWRWFDLSSARRAADRAAARGTDGGAS
ncbi:lycopene cyclase domain-containing protein [Cellulomonas dongxiuzhuiae]|uniref:Lycopene cyclase domain-containing protein n=1 Tax=Cellulomonas dongxiuzhuiae TaxID=2819979 RepID=A0ABX8GH57_9CELL|nr:lycopene cyclase domain-containing protein [Cellulomonas dongxiuzhuiae]MBO3088204.1 lycopene cyclase domain-containing protein [Cellulomonas dongxiuzhuiae]MBO3094449.1 lycopene cyclase domain-containing protein [Cellulomonas dongxiuzhuiae]QWC15474.1 lycopene cyclase domain-containing protein [Cellulomonas dongxiuzhuiae]